MVCFQLFLAFTNRPVLVLKKKVFSLIAALATTGIAGISNAQTSPLAAGFPSWLTTIPIEQINLEDLFGGTLPPGLFNPPGTTQTPPQTDSNFGANVISPNSDNDDDDIELIKPVFQQPITPDTTPSTANNDVLCGSWNSFITPAIHVLELSHFESSTKTIAYHLYNQEGQLVGDGEEKIAPALEKDVVLNKFLEQLPQQIGTICVSGAASANGRISTYKQMATNTATIEFVANWPLTSGKLGIQHVALNTFYPFRDAKQSNFVVSNWIELTNLSANEETGTLTIYKQNGDIVEQSILTLAPRARLDIPGHTIGANAIGSARWTPRHDDAKFMLSTSRYYHNNATFQDTYAAATIVTGSFDKRTFITLVKNEATSNEIIELSNATESANKISIKLSDTANTEIFSVTLQPNASFHIATTALNAEGKSILVSAEKQFSAQLLAYNYANDAALQSVATLEKLEKSSKTLSTAYNTYLETQCTLRVFNRSKSDQNVLVTMQRDSGKVMLGKNFHTFTHPALDGEPYFIAAATSLDIDLCRHEERDQVGLITLFTDAENSSLSALLIKTNGDTSFSDYLALTAHN